MTREPSTDDLARPYAPPRVTAYASSRWKRPA